MSYRIQGAAEGADAGPGQRPQLGVPQQVGNDLQQPARPHGNGVPPQLLRLLAPHVLVHPRQRGQRL